MARQNNSLRANAQSSDIRKATASEVDVLTIVLPSLRADVVVKVLVHSRFLVPSSLEVVAEATRRSRPSSLRGKTHCATNGSDVRACRWEDRVELRRLAVLVQARSTNASIARGLEDRHAAKTEDADQVANTNGVLLWYGLFVISIGVGDDLWQLAVRPREKELVVRQVRFVLIGCASGLNWVWDVRTI